MMASTLAEQLAVKPVGPNEFITNYRPLSMGNTAKIAYGGSTIGVAVRAACCTAPESFRLYSVLGHFLGPTTLAKVLKCRVTSTRTTKSFATRRVEVFQEQADGSERAVMDLLADFHVVEKGMLQYSSETTIPYSGVDASQSVDENLDALISQGKLHEDKAKQFKESFRAQFQYFETRSPPESMSAQNLIGLTNTTETSQDALPLAKKSSADWYRLRERLDSQRHGDEMAVLAFLMDGGLSFLPLTHSNLYLTDAGACSSLDFALRVFHPDVDLNRWHLRERTTSVGDHARTFSEGKLWEEGGRLVASMTQQSILRPKPKSNPKARKTATKAQL